MKLFSNITKTNTNILAESMRTMNVIAVIQWYFLERSFLRQLGVW